MPKPLVIVESPAKARTLSRFLGSKYRVEASYGHVRDLPESAAEVPKDIKGKPWGRLGVDTEGEFKPYYVVPADKKKYVQQLKAALKDASEVILATDPDREGESISWHLKEVLKPKVRVRRIVFHEITEEAIKAALREAHEDVDENLVRAQESRRILDRLYGYTLSPVLVEEGPDRTERRPRPERRRPSHRRTGRRADGVPHGVLLGSRSEDPRRGSRVRRHARADWRSARRDRQGFRRAWTADGKGRSRPRRNAGARTGQRSVAEPAVDRHQRRRKTVHAAPGAALHDVHPAAGRQSKVRLFRRADDAGGAAVVPGRRHRRR